MNDLTVTAASEVDADDSDVEELAPALPLLTILHREKTPEAWLGSRGMMLIDPDEALTLLATGTLHDGLPIKHWLKWAPNAAEDGERFIEEGRRALARELVLDAIAAGRLHCVFVRKPDDIAGWCIEAIDPEQFRGGRLEIGYEDNRFGISVEYDGAYFEASGFQFMWPEVCRLRPSLANLEAVAPDEPARSVVAPTHLEPLPGRTRKARGRSAKPYGKAIGMVLARAARFGIEEAAAAPNKEVGHWLLEAYEELKVSPVPDHADAGRDAKAAIIALRDIMAGSQSSDD